MHSNIRLLFLMMAVGFFVFLQIFSYAQLNSTAPYNTSNHNKEVIGYFTQWDAWKAANAGLPSAGVLTQLNIDYTQYTILNWSFLGVAEDGSLHSGDLRNQQIYQEGQVQPPGPMFWDEIYSSWDYWLLYGCLEIIQYLPDNLDEQPTHASYWVYEDYGYKGNGTGWVHLPTGETGAYPLPLPTDSNTDAPGLIELCQANNVKLMASIGGWSMSRHFPEMAADPVKRARFVEDCVELINMGFEGIDIDWEYPNNFGMNITNHGPNDYENFAILVEDIRAAIGPNKYITAAFSASPANLAGFDWPRLTNSMTYFNMMSYDYEGGWSDFAGHNSALYGDDLSWDNTFDFMVNTMDVDPAKINMGTAFYGRGVKTSGGASLGAPTIKVSANVQPDGPIITASDFTNWAAFDGTPLYYYLNDEITDPANGWTLHWDNVAEVPYATKGDYFLSYDDEQSIGLKAEYVNQNNIAGVIIWTTFGDCQIGAIENAGCTKFKAAPTTTTPLVNKLNEVFTTGSSELVVTITSQNESCPGSADGSATAIPSDGTAPYTYLWNTTANSATINGLAPGDYTVTATDSSSPAKMGIKTIAITSSGAMTLSTATTSTSTGNAEGIITLAVSGGATPYTYAWNNGATTQNISGLTAGNYSVTVTDANGCTAGDMATVLDGEPNALCSSNYLVGYWHNWNDGSAPYIPLDQVDPRYNVVNLSFAVPSAGNDYDMTFPLCCGETQAGLISKIQTLQSKGVTVNISIGGATAPVHLTSVAEKNTFISSMNIIINTYGFDGLDIDLEGASISTTGGTIASPVDAELIYFIEAIQQIIADYSATHNKPIFLSAAPETAFVQGGMSSWGNIWGAYLPVLDALRNDMDLLHVQLYNSGSMYGIDGGVYNQGTADFIVSQVEAVIIGFNAGGGGFFNGFPEGKVAVGLPACPSAAGGGFTNTATVASAINYLMGNGPQPGSYTLQAGPYPGLAGMMTWSINWDAVSSCNNSSYEYATSYENIFECTFGLNITVDQSPSCLEDTQGMVTATASQGTAPYTYAWSNGATGATNSGLVAGAYTVTATDGAGLTATESVTLTDPFSMPTPDVPAVFALCNMVPESITIANEASFPAGTTWAWHLNGTLLTGATSSTYAGVSSAGTYMVMATNGTCSSEANTVVTSSLPTPMDASGCEWESIVLGIDATNAGAGPFEWYDAPTGGNLLNTGTSYTTPGLSSTTTYYVANAAATGAAGTITGPSPTDDMGDLNAWTGASQIIFNVTNTMTLQGFSIAPIVWNCAAVYSMEIQDPSGAILLSQSYTLDGVALPCSSAGLNEPIALTFPAVTLAPGTGYKIVTTGSISLGFWSTPPYPMAYDDFTITGGNAGTTYMAVYDWVLEGGSCTGRVPVVATVLDVNDPECNECPDHLVKDEVYVSAATYHANMSVSSAGKVEAGTEVHFRAGGHIFMEAGFEVELGAEFSAEIEVCPGAAVVPEETPDKLRQSKRINFCRL